VTSAYAVVADLHGSDGGPAPQRGRARGTGIDPTDDAPAENILQHCIDSLAEVLSITSPANMARVQRISRVTAALGARCGVSRPHHLARLAFASQLGTLSLPETIALKMHHGRLLTDEERRMMRGIVDLGGNLLARIPGLEADCEILRLHNVHAVPLGPLPLESAVMRVAIAYDRLEAGGLKPDAAVAMLRSRDPMYDSEVLDVLEAYGPESLVDKLERAVSVNELVPHMVLTRDVTGADGTLLLGTGHELSDVIIQRLQTLAERQVIRETILVAMLDDEPAA
jgi:hypothetical protein